MNAIGEWGRIQFEEALGGIVLCQWHRVRLGDAGLGRPRHLSSDRINSAVGQKPGVEVCEQQVRKATSGG